MSKPGTYRKTRRPEKPDPDIGKRITTYGKLLGVDVEFVKCDSCKFYRRARCQKGHPVQYRLKLRICPDHEPLDDE